MDICGFAIGALILIAGLVIGFSGLAAFTRFIYWILGR